MAWAARFSCIALAGALAACGGTTVSGGSGGTGGTTDAAAGSGGTAGSGGCPTGYADCNGDPSDGCETHIASDPAHCGACNTACTSPPGGATECVNGACQVCACSPGRGNCNHDCSDGCEVDTQTDVNNCGFCGHACSAPQGTAACINGKCAVKACDPGFADCDGDPSDGCEIHIAADPYNCGSCGTQCPSNNGGPPTCNAGSCIQMCCDQPGYALCGGDCSTGSCDDLMNDPQNCGYCGHVCPATAAGCPATCVQGVCGFPGCTPGMADCDCIASNGCETNLATDVNNCGTCGHPCASGQSCVGGLCK